MIPEKKAVFITATGTDVGKTFISALLVKKLRANGQNAGYFKAALSGAEEQNGRLIPGDAQYVCSEGKLSEPPESLVSYIYRDAVSPHLAAIRENRPVELTKIESDFYRLSQKFDYLIVEGSGGIICPIRRDSQQSIMLTDIIQRLNLDVLIVSPSGLGSINSAVLTAEYARQKNIFVKGFILNYYEKENPMHQDNKYQIEELTGLPVLSTVSKNTATIDIKIDSFI